MPGMSTVEGKEQDSSRQPRENDKRGKFARECVIGH